MSRFSGRQFWTRFVIGCGVVLGAAALLPVVSWVTVLLVMRSSFTPDNPRGMQQLQSLVRSAQPLTDALSRYRHRYGTFPADLKSLSPASTGDPMPSRWDYSRENKNSYTLYYSLGWDPGLRYEYVPGATKGWEYDPGNGNPKVPILTDAAP